MDGELTHDIIDNVLETLQAYCACRDDCEGCRYIFTRKGRIFPSCVLEGTPDNWRTERLGGDDDERP